MGNKKSNTNDAIWGGWMIPTDAMNREFGHVPMTESIVK